MVSAKIEDEMELMKERAVRFYPEEKQQQPKSSRLPTKFGGMKFGRIESWSTGSSKVFAEDHVVWEKGILDPGSELVLTWNRIFLFACLLALFVDPLFFYLPSVGGDSSNQTSCVKLDHNMSIIVTLIRTFADFFYVVNILVKFRTAYVAPSSRVFGRGELVMNRKKISRKYLKSDFSLDFAAALPLPQIVVWIIIPAIRSSNADNNNNGLAMIVLFQYALRLYSIFPLSNKIIKATGVVTNTAWAGAVYNLILYMLASHVLGASWYLLSLDRQTTCWKSECSKETTLMQTTTGCHARFLSCDFLNDEDQKLWANHTSIFSKCNASDDSISFQYGIFSDALTKGTVSTGFIRKYFYCLWWGLQNLSSYGQNLMTSTYIGETSFAILIAIIGLVLFAHLIGNMQTYLQSLTVRLEQWRLKRRDTEEWMQHRQLPHELRNRVRKFLQYKWFATQGVNEESILKALPSDLRRDIQRHLCLDLVKRVPLFSQMDGQLLDAICERLVSSLSTEGTYIVCEGDPVTEMLFIIRGRLESSTTNGGRTGFFNSITLRPGDFCGEELLAWALVPRSSAYLPSSTRTVKALIEVEAFALRAEDLKFVANQFRRLHSKKLQQTFRFYSHHWRTWGAFFIQAAWHRSRKRKMAKYLNKYESMSSTISDENIGESCQEENCDVCSSGSKALLACKFSASTRRGAQRVKDEEVPKLRKPDEPDFSAN